MNEVSFKKTIKKLLAYITYGLYRYSSRTPEVLSINETLDILINTQKSLVRFGDGEILLMNGRGTSFQNSEMGIADSLKNILISKQENLIVALPDVFDGLEEYVPSTRSFWQEHLFFFGQTYVRNCSTKIKYGNAFVSRCYMMFRDKSSCGIYFEKFKQIFKDKNLLVVEGVNTHNGVGNDLFSQAKTVSRIIAPGKNAFAVREQILQECLHFAKETLILFSLGIAAKGLVYELVQRGYRVLDIGNLDMEYEWFLMQAKEKAKLEKHGIIGIESNRNVGYTQYLEEVICWIEGENKWDI